MKPFFLFVAWCVYLTSNDCTDITLSYQLEYTWKALCAESHMIKVRPFTENAVYDRELIIAQMREFQKQIRLIIAHDAQVMSSSETAACVEAIFAGLAMAWFKIKYENIYYPYKYSQEQTVSALSGLGVGVILMIDAFRNIVALDRASTRFKRLVALDDEIEQFLCSMGAN